MANVSALRLPTGPGWWARLKGGRVKWFRVRWIDFSEPSENGNELAVWDEDREQFMRVAELTSPLTRWYGPVEIPNDPEEL